jgi:hypothetical protein
MLASAALKLHEGARSVYRICLSDCVKKENRSSALFYFYIYIDARQCSFKATQSQKAQGVYTVSVFPAVSKNKTGPQPYIFFLSFDVCQCSFKATQSQKVE